MDLNLKVEGGAFGYRADQVLFTDLDFKICGGEIVAVIGPNGAGKTTFLRCLMGMLPWRKGRTLLDGIPIKQIPRRSFWQTVAYVPQARSMPFAFSVLDIVLMGRTAHIGPFSQPSEKDRQIAVECLKRMGILQLRERSFAELSGGEAQMVLIARALANRPKLIVLDEPESHLDARNQLIILEALKRLSIEDRIACIVNTHHPDSALRIANKALVIGKGDKGHLFGPAAELLTEKVMERYFDIRIKKLSFQDSETTYQAIYALEPVC